jgi:membrane associated rhomboid family serine protease
LIDRLTNWRVVTLSLVACNCVVYLLLAWAGTPENHTLIESGANWGPLTLGSQPWRLLAAMFLHANALHLIENMIMLLIFGFISERRLGSPQTLSLFVTCGVGAGIWEVALRPDVLAVGASGGICGLAGALVSSYLSERSRSGLIRAVGICALWLPSFVTSNTDPFDRGIHLFATALGVALGALVVTIAKYLPDHAKASHLGVVILLVVAFIHVRLKNGYIPALDSAIKQFSYGNDDAARVFLQQVLQHAPDNVTANRLRAEIDMKSGEFTEAETILVGLNNKYPYDDVTMRLLARTYLKIHRPDSAFLLVTGSIMHTRSRPTHEDLVIMGEALEMLGNHLGAGDYLAAIGEYEEAKRSYKAALQADPDNIRAKAGLEKAIRALQSQ